MQPGLQPIKCSQLFQLLQPKLLADKTAYTGESEPVSHPSDEACNLAGNDSNRVLKTLTGVFTCALSQILWCRLKKVLY